MDTAIKEATDTPSQAEQIGGLIDRFEQTSAFAAGPLPARATSSIDTRALVNSGALPAIDIDTQAAACETTYTRADWEREQLSLSKSLARADEILADGDIKSFKRFFADPNLSPTVREKFMEQNGKRKIEQTFGNDSIMFSSDTEVQDALEYVKYGKNDVRTLIDRQSRFWGVDKGGVANALKSMSAEEQELFNSGKQMTLSQEPAITEEQAKAKEYYYAVHSALVKASGNNTWDSEQTDPGEVERWEQLIKGQSTQASAPLDVCELQKTAVRAGQRRTFEEQAEREQARIDEQKSLDARRQRFLDSIPELVKNAAAQGYRSVIVMNLETTGNYKPRMYREDSYSEKQTENPYRSYREAAQPREEPKSSKLNDWQQKVYDQIKADGLEPSIEYLENKSYTRYTPDEAAASWQLVARW